jgi:hypothetical protein
MNPKTNELRDTSGMKNNEIKSLQNDGFVPLPQHLNRAARRKLSGRKSVKIPFNSKSNLNKWAQQVRENQDKGKLKQVDKEFNKIMGKS